MSNGELMENQGKHVFSAHDGSLRKDEGGSSEENLKLFRHIVEDGCVKGAGRRVSWGSS